MTNNKLTGERLTNVEIQGAIGVAAQYQGDSEEGRLLYLALRELQEYRNAAPVVPGDGRDQFEEWFGLNCKDKYSIVHLHRANGGANYRDPRVDLAWIAWKDSRAAMQIKP